MPSPALAAAPRAGPRRVTFVTSPARCNLRCRMCREHSPLAPPPAAPELPFDLVAAVLDELRGTGLEEVIPSTQGEPLLWPHLERLVDRCAADGVRLNVTTNGTFPRLGARGWAERLVPVASDVKVSWNGATAATAERLMEGLRFEEALVNVRTLVRTRDAARARGGRACTVTFQVTAQEANVGELAAIVRLAAALGVERVKLNGLQVHFAALAAEDLRRDAASRGRWNRSLAVARAAAAETGVRLEGARELDPAGEVPARGACPFLGLEAWVGPDGRFAPCPAALHGELGDFGSVAETALGAIWAGDAYAALVAGDRGRGRCADCAFRRPGGL